MKIRWNDHRKCWEVVECFRVLNSFSSLHHAEVWVIAESKAREGVA
jgi:hypothetical protein